MTHLVPLEEGELVMRVLAPAELEARGFGPLKEEAKKRLATSTGGNRPTPIPVEAEKGEGAQGVARAGAILMDHLPEVSMSNHPNRSQGTRGGARNPTPAEVRAAREKAGMTQTAAAEVIYGRLQAWQNWKNDQDPNEQRRMHPGLFELFLAKTGQMRK